ncbi:hypothetical protein N8I71_20445 [Roseibacterium sp. SDUM158016]|uniref:hypothetical protein n=1 Tax=Roseicyclus sediminis TaxID=2980997 RepID=UPI0021D2883B|nr:hypothetical protein [Roseibacterium sp. SDUM158016]MCU4655219.1 hypothetical protein [Roseibacterium sp. SDUM158016]
MNRLVLLILVLLAGPARADTMIADAFGLYPSSSDGARAGWSGLQSDLFFPEETRVMEPGPADTVLIVFGEKSLVAGDGTGLAAALLFDAAGNLVTDGTAVRLSAADGTRTQRTRGGIASRQVQAGSVTGRFHASAETGSGATLRQSSRVSYRVIPALSGLAAELTPPAAALPAEEILQLEAAPLTGASGALPPDGVAGALFLSHADGSHTFVPATWIGGALQAPMLSRDIAGAAAARLFLPFSESAPVPVEIARLAPGAALNLSATALPTIGATRLSLGPFTTSQGHHLHDGSPVQLRVRDAAGRVFQSENWLLDGVAEETVPSRDLPFDIVVTSPLGTSRLTLMEATQ